MRGFPVIESLENRVLLTGTAIYVESNNPTPGANEILAFRRKSSGQLSQVGHFATGGRGFLNATDARGPDDSDGQIIASADNRFLFAVNQGSDNVSVFRINPDRSLNLVGVPVSSGGVQPVSLSIVDGTLYVLNKGDGNPLGTPGNYTAFVIGLGGRLTQIADSTITIPAGISPSQVLASRDGQFVFGDNFFPVTLNPSNATPSPAANTLDAFVVQIDQTISRALGTPLATTDNVRNPGLLGLATHPRLPILYGGLVSSNLVGVFTFDPTTGEPTFVGPVGDMGKAPGWLLVNDAGSRLYVVNSESDSIGVFSLTNPLRPQQIQEFKLNGPRQRADDKTPATLDLTAAQLALDPGGKFLYVMTQEHTLENDFPQGNALHVLHVSSSSGKLSENSNSPKILSQNRVPAGAHPQGLIALQPPPENPPRGFGRIVTNTSPFGNAAIISTPADTGDSFFFATTTPGTIFG